MIKTLKAPFRRAPVFYEDVTVSTNTQLKEMAADGAENGTVLISGSQTGGRGRRGRSFLSPEGGLYLSMLLKFPKFDERLSSITAVTAVAVSSTLDRELGTKTAIKWPNDIRIDGRKLCGILTEAVSRGTETDIVVGIGINLNAASFPDELKTIATSVLAETGRKTDIDSFAMSLVSALDGYFENAPDFPPSCLEEYRARCDTLGKDLPSGGTAVRIEDDYSLAVRNPDGSEYIKFFGEI